MPQVPHVPDRPLDAVTSIKVKLATLIVGAVGITVFVFWFCIRIVHVWPSAAGVIAGAVALILVSRLARGMTSPLREMAAATQAMAKGDYSQTITATSHDEVGRLAAAFNRMAAELAETDRVRRDLVANVSHELRTPLTALQATLENLIDGVAPADHRTLQTMLTQVERLGRLVTQLLDLSRLEAGTVPLDRHAFAIEPVLAHAVRGTCAHSNRHIWKRHSEEISASARACGFTSIGRKLRLRCIASGRLLANGTTTIAAKSSAPVSSRA